MSAPAPGGRLFWASAAVGALIVGAGLRGFWINSSPRSRASFVPYFLGAGIAHDALWAPAAVVLLAVTARVVPAPIRGAVRIGLAFTVLLILVSWAQVRRYGASTRNPSLLPLDYGQNLVLLLLGIWVVVAAVAMLKWVRRAP